MVCAPVCSLAHIPEGSRTSLRESVGGAGPLDGTKRIDRAENEGLGFRAQQESTEGVGSRRLARCLLL